MPLDPDTFVPRAPEDLTPEECAATASGLARAENWLQAAQWYESAEKRERRSAVPDLSKIRRWAKASERCRENAELPSEGW